MNVRNCRQCGRIFNYVAGPFLCQVCREKMELKFQEVKEYIRENPGVSIPQVSEACDVEPSQIRQWLREERLEVTEDSAIFLNCDGCGMPIRCGKYCDKCKGNLASGLKNVLHENEARKASASPKNSGSSDNPRMRFL
ncbi:MAG: flagellar protein [Lachnospiraceae bacterium]|nr:flagellar protein [Lachnospiraceae bacterium]